LVTELSAFPEEHIDIFHKEDRLVILKALQEARTVLEPLHRNIETELDAVF
jgi:virulence-associated protein VagC